MEESELTNEEKIEKDEYKERHLKQIKDWVNGKSIHNEIDGECCPDFSCCDPTIQTPLEIKKLFLDAYIQNNEKVLNSLLYAFLFGIMSDAEKPFVANGRDEIGTIVN